jgi:hypothetical protein
MLPPISEEQLQIIREIEKDNNVLVDSVAGSGKTTCNLHIANYFTNKKILLLTYNAKLKIETRERAGNLDLNNIETHSYHSFGVKYYHNQCFTDTELNDIIVNNTAPIKQFDYDLILLDESQDINPTYYKFIRKIFNNNISTNINICVLGDEKQSIFQFNGADQRFLTLADCIFNQNNKLWVKCSLSHSFRISTEMSYFINNSMNIKKQIISNKQLNILPQYIICNAFGDYMFKKFRYYYETLHYSANDIFILAPSVKSAKTPVIYLENRIKETYGDKINIFVPTSDESKLDPDVVKDKLIFSTFHQSKGLERKVVFVFGFDNSYFNFYAKNSDPYECPNTFYVAATRASEHLILCHHFRNNYLPFLDNIEKYCDFTEHEKLNVEQIKSNDKKYPIRVGVTDLINHQKSIIIDDFFKKLSITLIREQQDIISIESKVPTKNSNSYEQVSDINGVAIPSYIELQLKGNMTIYNSVITHNEPESIIRGKLSSYINKVKNINLSNIKPKDLLFISNVYSAIKSKYICRVKQISKYNWLPEDKLLQCVNRVNNLHLNISSSFEKEYDKELNISCFDNTYVLTGIFDYEDDEKIIEFKCVNSFSNEHFIQLAIYRYLYGPTNKRFILYNILSDEAFELHNQNEELEEMVIKLIIAKYLVVDEISNEHFINNCNM